MDDFSSCLKCGSQFPDPAVRFCSLCGGRILSSRKARRLGWLSLTAGILLVGIIVFIALWVRFSDSRWEGTREFAAYAITLGVFIVVFGLVAMAAGIWQIRNGTRNKMLTYTTIALALAMGGMMVTQYLLYGN